MTLYQVGNTIVEKYDVYEVKRGGMGIVYLCYDLERKIPVALKTFDDKFLDSWIIRDLFMQEVLTWINLGSHPNIVRAYRLEQFEGKPHILVEMVAGPEGIGADLRSWLVHRRLNLRQALEFGIHICNGME